jgi:hypothetical protein
MSASPRYKIGEIVRLNRVTNRALRAPASFEIVALLPSDGRSYEYRVRSEQEHYERVVREDDLEIPNQSTAGTDSNSADVVFPVPEGERK